MGLSGTRQAAVFFAMPSQLGCRDSCEGACRAPSFGARLKPDGANKPPSPACEGHLIVDRACSGASKPAANGYYEVDMSPETVHLKLTVTTAEDVAVALIVEVCCALSPLECHPRPV